MFLRRAREKENERCESSDKGKGDVWEVRIKKKLYCTGVRKRTVSLYSVLAVAVSLLQYNNPFIIKTEFHETPNIVFSLWGSILTSQLLRATDPNVVFPSSDLA